MSKLGINTGSSPNDGQGDSLRVAMGKINHNFTEIYDTFGDGNTIVSYAGTAGISTVAENLTGRPRVEVSGILNTGITTTEHIEVRNITSTGIITAVQFVGDGSQISNVVAEWSGIDVLDDSVRKGVARELDFGNGLFVGPPDGRGRVLVALSTSVVSGGGTVGGGTTLEFRNQNSILGTYSKVNFDQNLLAYVNSVAGVVTVTTAPNINLSGVMTATSFYGNFVGDGSGLSGITADSAWPEIQLPGDFFGDYGQPLGIHTSKHVGIGRTADSATVLYVEAATVGSAGTPYGLRVDGFANINNVRFDYTTEGYTRFLFPSSQTIVGGDGNGYYSALQYNQLTSTPFHIRSHSKFTKTVQIGTSFYDLGSGPILYPGIFMDGGTATIAVGLGITINGGTGIITATGFSGGAGGVNVSGAITATSFSGDGSGLTGISTFSGDYNDLTNQPTIPSIVGLASEGYVDSSVSGLASEGYVDTQIGIRTFSGNYNDLTNQPTIPVNITDLSDVNAGAPSTGQVLKWSGSEWTAAADLVGEGGAGIGLSDLSVTISPAGINSLTYNNLTGVFQFTPTDLSSYVTSSGSVSYASSSGTSGGLTGTPNISVNEVGISSYLSVTGVSSFYNNVHIESEKTILIGDNDELQLFHSGVDSYIDNNSSGNLIIRDSGLGIQLRRSGGGPGAGLMAAFNNDAGVELYYNSVIKLETFENGVAINDSVGIGTTAGNPPYRLTVSGVGATVTQGLLNAIADLTSSVDGYGQVNIRNSRSAANASGDLVITADTGTDASDYINLGINNTGFTTSSWTINGPLDGYLYTSDRNISIGAASAGRYLSLFAGDTLIENEKVRVTEDGVGIGSTQPTSMLAVDGDVSVSGVITATSFSGSGVNLTGVVTSLVGYATEGYVDAAVAGVSTFSGDYNDLINQPSIPSIVGLASEGYVDAAVAGVSTFSGDYNDLINQPSIPSIVGLASEGYVDAAVSVVGSGGTWAVNASGIHTSKNVGIGTELSSSALWVEGNGYFSGVVTATRFESTSAGTPTIDSPNNLNINAINVAISTDLTVGGDAYVGVDTSSGLILTSPNGTQYRLVVDNSGNLSTVLVP